MRPRRSRAIRKYLRRQKAFIRRTVHDPDEQRRRIVELVARFPLPRYD